MLIPKYYALNIIFHQPWPWKIDRWSNWLIEPWTLFLFPGDIFSDQKHYIFQICSKFFYMLRTLQNIDQLLGVHMNWPTGEEWGIDNDLSYSRVVTTDKNLILYKLSNLSDRIWRLRGGHVPYELIHRWRMGFRKWSVIL